MLSVYAQELQALKAELHHTIARMGDGSTMTASSAPAPSSSQGLAAGSLPYFVTPGVRSSSSSSARPSQNTVNERWSGARPPTSTASWSIASTRTVSTATTTPEAPDSNVATELQQQRVVQAPRGSAGTTWDARHLIHELRTASQRRRELEVELANEMKREQERVQQQQQQRDARIPWQNAIAALQRQRAEIAREIEIESQRDPFAAGDSESDSSIHSKGEGGDHEKKKQNRVLYRDSSTQMSPLPQTPPVRPGRKQQATIAGSASDSANQYSIEGVVTLGPLQKNGSTSTHSTTAATVQRRERVQHATTAVSTGTAATNHHNPPSPVFKHELYGRPELHHDALNEVFSIQLKFAETMLKLEKSVQIRDQLLQRNAAATTARENRSRRRGIARTSAERASAATLGQHYPGHSDSESHYEDDMLSSDYDSFSSGASLGDYAVRLRRYTSDNDDLEVRAPSTPSATRGASAASAGEAASSSANPAAADAPQTSHFNLSAVEEEAEGDGDGASESPSSHEQRTPSTESSDKTSNSSTTKQVRFGDDGEYSTPLIARKFNFENQSDDEDDLESILSFMDGSSVTSSELNDVSLIKAFEMFRRELGMLKAPSPQQQLKPSSSGITAAISAARALFANDDGDINDDAQRDMLKPIKSKPATIVKQMIQDNEAANPADRDPVVVANAGIDTKHQPQQKQNEELPTVEALSERRRQLCLDIQAESAQLVLTFGSRNAHQTERIKQNLIQLRSELRTVDEQLKSYP